MTIENELINKSYYQTIVAENEKEHPIKVLGEMYMNEMQKKRPDLSSIRYAQGEVYFLNNDYEAAIYKWGTPLDDRLIPWAQKNIADAHFEMGLLELAEECYKAVDTDVMELKVEVLLQLFSLYIQQGSTEKAIDAIKNAVQLNPDYSYVTQIAQSYFEDIKDWNSAVELAVNESIRTQSLSWVSILEEYVEQGLTYDFQPNCFNEVLVTVLHIDKLRFESLSELLWNSYKHSNLYIPWLKEINQLLLTYNLEEAYMWKKLPNLFKESYFDLISGEFLISDISVLIQDHLTNWLEISTVSDSLISSSAILAWNDIFPSDLDVTLVSKAEDYFEHSNSYQYGRQEGIKLFESIKQWAEKEGLLDDLYVNIMPMIEEYNIEVASPSKIRSIIKATIAFLVEKRIEVENAVIDNINWDEELLVKLQDIQLQLDDMEKDEARVIKDSFRKIKNDLSQHMMLTLPELLRNCSELVHEDSDFGKLHVDLNDEMNRRIADYMENTALHDFKHAFQRWIEDCEREFNDCQIKLNEISEGFNYQYNEEKIVLEGDFKVLDDWKRDMERISRGMLHIEKANIMLRNNPSQLLLKGAGKLLGSISKSNEKLHSKYKNYIENGDYSQITQEIINPLIKQLELFEGSIEWDISKFFSNSLEVLNRVSEELHGDIEKQNYSLETMRNQPEIYRDPLTLFELRLRQYELMNTIS
ncbi:tetratricopeptide repeat protein [Ornithinibacillus bavariensis]|uniref:tetratricopeptide repeat protein n=1 Tax=Ornithinibacillus bavariensis TaxID=545502 RepID=UPI000EBFAF5D|nr:hypothetical protein [Ornithinibacillus sp.]